MYATIRRYEGVERESLNRNHQQGQREPDSPPERVAGLRLQWLLPVRANGVLTSIGLFDTSSHLDESNRVAAKVLQEENLQPVMPNPPKITSGKLMAHKMPEFVGV
jgi:hypothetical protein